MLFFFSFQASLPCFPCALAFIIEQDLFSINVIDSGRSLVIFQRFLWNDMSKNGFSTSIETGKYHYMDGAKPIEQQKQMNHNCH